MIEHFGIDLLTTYKTEPAPDYVVKRANPERQKINSMIAQKRRLLINAIKAMNYNCEKWLQCMFKSVHSKKDETLSLIRNLWRQPGQIRVTDRTVEIRLKPLGTGTMHEGLDSILKILKENNQLRMPDVTSQKLTADIV